MITEVNESHSFENRLEGLKVADRNYDAALKFLENRNGNKEMIINHHMNKLLDLSLDFKS